jgi:predicted enzyme related to lactoylglutathione lyase
MPTVTTHAPGTFCWPELTTSDPIGAKKFYSGLFGWQIKDQDMGPQGVYTIFTRDGSDVSACYKMDEGQAKTGMPPYWGSYIAVESADAAAAKAKTLGGTVLMEPFDVMEHGRMAVITDPQGATFCVWQAKKHIGATVIGEPNSLGWTQLNAKDTGVAKKFYTELIGWKTQDDPMGPEFGGGYYTTWLKADGPAGGMMAMPPMPGGQNVPSHWLPYFAVANVDSSTAKAASLGAKTYVPPSDIPGTGRFSVLADPQGATFALVTFTKG